MQGYVTTEDYRASTKMNGIQPEELEVLEVGRNSVGAFQLLFHDGKTNQLVLGQQLALPNNLSYTTYRVVIEGDLPVEAHLVDYYQDDQDVFYADKLLETNHHLYSGDRMAPIYVEIPVNRTQKPGEYQLKLKLMVAPLVGTETCVWERELTVRVATYTFPDHVTQDFNLNIWQQPSNLARTFEVEPWGMEHQRLIKEMAQNLAEVGQKAITVIASEVPWKGWFSYAVKDYPANLFEYSMIPVKRKSDGELECDFAHLDQYINTMLAAGVNQELDLFGWLGIWQAPFFPGVPKLDYPEQIIIRCLDENSHQFGYLNTKTQVQEYFQKVVAHLKETEMWDKTYIVADEPKVHMLELFKQSIKELKQVVPDAKLKVTFDKTQALESLKDEVDYLVTSFNCTCQNSELDCKQFYVCNYPDKPNTFLASPLLETRLLPILAYWTKTDGLLRWAYNCWPTNALTDIRYNTNSLPVGDLCLVYPSKSGHLLPSLRLKQLYRGIEDFALLKQAEQIDPKQTQTVVANFLGEIDSKKWMQDSHTSSPDRFRQTTVRFKQLRQILQQICS